MNKLPNKAESGGTCPVKHSDDDVTQSNNNTSGPSTSHWWKLLFSPSPPHQAIATVNSNTNQSMEAAVSKCPVSNDRHDIPASLEEAARYAQTPQPDQTIPLARERQVSSIPRGNTMATMNDTEKIPHHQLIHNNNNNNKKDDDQSHDDETIDKKWVYPSEQQMFNAMRKKGWTNVPEESIPVVLQIHNHINESTWNQILEWENATSSSSSSQVQLVRFQGRPNDISPKAFLLSSLLRLYNPPFDRHDWYVQNNNNNNNNNNASSSSSGGGGQSPGRIQRYVIDYYYLEPPSSQHSNATMPPSPPLPIPYIDARPALDHPYAIYLHARRFCQLAFPGITAYLKMRQQQQQENHPTR